MQNKPNFGKAQMNVSSVKTMNYEQITMNNTNKKQTQFKPKQTQFQTQRLSVVLAGIGGLVQSSSLMDGE